MGTKVQTAKICEVNNIVNNIPIVGEPAGDLHYSSAVVLSVSNEPGTADIIRAARGEWIYNVLRMSVSIDRPPIGIHLAIDSHPSLAHVRREYIYPTDIMPQFRSALFEGSYNAFLENFYHQIAVLTLPGDKVFMHFFNKKPFRGELRILSC